MNRLSKLLIVVILLVGCGKSEMVSTQKFISANEKNVSSSEAIDVYSKIFGIRTKSTIDDVEISLIDCVDGTPGIYIINGDSGSALISASRAFYPVLAVIPDAHCPSVITNNNPMSVLVEGYLNAISHSDSTNIKKFSDDWSKYLGQQLVNRQKFPPRYLSRVDYGDYNDALVELIDRLELDGYEWCFLSEQPVGLPDDVYESFCSLARENEDYRYDMYHSVIAYRDNSSFNSTQPLLSTLWHQGDPYDSALTNGATMGCVTIAVAQIMKYHEYPIDINWSDMPNATSTNTLASFLADLRRRLLITHSGGGTYIMANQVFNNFGYNTTVEGHIPSHVINSLKSPNNNPVFMRGKNSHNDGHAWVCDGYRLFSSVMEYELYIVSPESEPLYFEFMDRYYGAPEQILSFHMNWGWESLAPGWFLDASFPQSSIEDLTFSDNRKNIIVSRP